MTLSRSALSGNTQHGARASTTGQGTVRMVISYSQIQGNAASGVTADTGVAVALLHGNTVSNSPIGVQGLAAAQVRSVRNNSIADNTVDTRRRLLHLRAELTSTGTGKNETPAAHRASGGFCLMRIGEARARWRRCASCPGSAQSGGASSSWRRVKPSANSATPSSASDAGSGTDATRKATVPSPNGLPPAVVGGMWISRIEIAWCPGCQEEGGSAVEPRRERDVRVGRPRRERPTYARRPKAQIIPIGHESGGEDQDAAVVDLVLVADHEQVRDEEVATEPNYT